MVNNWCIKFGSFILNLVCNVGFCRRVSLGRIIGIGYKVNEGKVMKCECRFCRIWLGLVIYRFSKLQFWLGKEYSVLRNTR